MVIAYSSHQFELHKMAPIVSRHSCSIDHCINVDLLLIQFNVALTEPKMMPTKEDSPLIWLHYKKPNLVYAAKWLQLQLKDSHTLVLTFGINRQGGSHGHRSY